MDPELVALASSAATALVGRLASDGWEQVKHAVGALWRRARPERPEEADAVERELAETRQEMLTARQSSDERAEQDLVAEWRGRLRSLLASDPALGEELRELLARLGPEEPDSGTGGSRVEMHATASDNAKVFMSGRDMHITGQ